MPHRGCCWPPILTELNRIYRDFDQSRTIRNSGFGHRSQSSAGAVVSRGDAIRSAGRDLGVGCHDRLVGRKKQAARRPINASSNIRIRKRTSGGAVSTSRSPTTFLRSIGNGRSTISTPVRACTVSTRLPVGIRMRSFLTPVSFRRISTPPTCPPKPVLRCRSNRGKWLFLAARTPVK